MDSLFNYLSFFILYLSQEHRTQISLLEKATDFVSVNVCKNTVTFLAQVTIYVSFSIAL